MVSLMAFVVWGNIITGIFNYYSKPRQSCQRKHNDGVQTKKRIKIGIHGSFDVRYYILLLHCCASYTSTVNTHNNIIFYYKIADKLTNDRASGLVGLSSVHARRLNVFELVMHVRHTAKTFLKNIA